MFSQRSSNLNDTFSWNFEAMPLQASTSTFLTADNTSRVFVFAKECHATYSKAPAVLYIPNFRDKKVFCQVSVHAKHQQTQL